MPKFYYINGPAGSGKTHQLVEYADFQVDAGAKIIISQPTFELMRETQNKLVALGVPVRRFYHKDGSNTNVVKSIQDYMTAANPNRGEVILITHAALKRLPPSHRKFWDLFVDETPGVLDHYHFSIAKTHQLFTSHVDASQEVKSGVLWLQALDRTGGLEDIAANPTGDQLLDVFKDVANQIFDPGCMVMAPAKSWNKLIGDPHSPGLLNVFSVLNSDFVEGYKSTTFMSANLFDTELFMVWSKLLSIDWAIHPLQLKLLNQSHQNGNRLKILYLFNNRIGMKLFDQIHDGHQTKGEAIEQFVVDYFKPKQFVWHANKSQNFTTLDHNMRLPMVSHGINRPLFRSTHNVAMLSVFNFKTPAYAFLQSIGLSPYEAQVMLNFQKDYQALMRCSLRDPEATEPVEVIVMSRDIAEWLQTKFPGSRVDYLGCGVDEPKRVGRPKITKTKTKSERNRENYLKRKAQKEAK